MVAPTRGTKGDSKVEVEPHSEAVVEPHKHRGVFIAKGEDVKDDVLFTMNLVSGEAVYNECRISVQNEDGTEIEYRVWDSFRCKLAAAIRIGMRDICIKPGARVLYLCAASAITVSHVSDIVGPEGMVYAVESSDRIGSDLVSMTEKRTNVLLITGDARNPAKYRMHVGIVDVIFFDVAQPDQARTLGQLVSHFLKAGGYFVMSVKANCSDLMASGESEFMDEVIKLRAEGLTPVEVVSLEPFENHNALITGFVNYQSVVMPPSPPQSLVPQQPSPPLPEPEPEPLALEAGNEWDYSGESLYSVKK